MAKLLQFTGAYPGSECQGNGSLWFQLKRMLGSSAPRPESDMPRSACFTIYEEANHGFVVFESGVARRIILAETGEDVECLAMCRIVMEMLNSVEEMVAALEGEEANAFRESLEPELRLVLRAEPLSRRPLFFLQDVDSADARLNGMFYQTIFLFHAALDKTWHERDPEVDERMYDHQDRTIQLWKNRAGISSLIAWRELIAEMLNFQEEARSVRETRPELTCVKNGTVDDLQCATGEEEVPSLDRWFPELEELSSEENNSKE